jgi:hypothetical protein
MLSMGKAQLFFCCRIWLAQVCLSKAQILVAQVPSDVMVSRGAEARKRLMTDNDGAASSARVAKHLSLRLVHHQKRLLGRCSMTCKVHFVPSS